MGKGRILKPVTTPFKSKTFFGFDTEDDTEGNLICGNIYDGNNYYGYANSDDFMQILRRLQNKHKKKKLYVAATNLEYDWVNSAAGYYHRFDLFYTSRLLFAKLKESNITLIDSMNYYPLGVEAQGNILGMKKIKIKVSDLKHEKIEKVDEYNRQDAKITTEFINRFQKMINIIGGELKHTIASTALDIFRRNFLKIDIKRPDDEDLMKIKQAYYGGRTEIFTMESISDKNSMIYEYDKNSMYPDVMKRNKMPDPNSIFYTKGIDYEGVSHVDVTVKDCYLPYLPYKLKYMKKNVPSWAIDQYLNDSYDGLFDDFVHPDMTKLVFPIGELSGWWTNHELRYAESHGLIKIKKLHESINFKRTDTFFTDFVNHLWHKRREYQIAYEKTGDKEAELGSYAVKMIMNSLYGKFFERVESQKVICDDMGIIETIKGDTYFPNHSNGIWAVYVTALAKTSVYEGYQSVLKGGGKLLYSDTDSILYNGKRGLLNEGKELGEWKLEGRYKYGRFYLPKTYFLVDEDNIGYVTAKGIPLDRNFLDDHFYLNDGLEGFKEHVKLEGIFNYRLCFLKNGRVMVRKPVKFKEASRRVHNRVKPNTWVYVDKTFRSDYTKRVVIEGGETRPLYIKKGMVIK